MKKAGFFVIVFVLLLAPLLLFAGESAHAGNIAVASDEKAPGSPVSDKMGRSPFYLIYDAQGAFIKAVDNPNFGKGGRPSGGKSAIDSITFDQEGKMTGGLAAPSREEREQIWKGFSDFFVQNGIAVVVAEQFGDEIVRTMNARGIACVEFKGGAQDAVGKVLQLQRQKEAVQ
jgi:predicted Fe-Mo cluster-binding NifX family protein